MLTVKSCCCGPSLQLGTLIILVFSVVFKLLQIIIFVGNGIHEGEFWDTLSVVLFKVIILCISVAGLKGVLQEIPSFLQPFLWLQLIYAVRSIILVEWLAFSNSGVFDIVLDFPIPEILTDTGAIVFYQIYYFIAAILHVYFFIVVRSFYKEFQSEYQV